MQAQFWLPIFAVFFVTLCNADSFTYWTDASCYKNAAWEDSLAEAFNMAKRASERLESSTDEDFAHVFQRIFGVSTSDKTLYKKSPNYVQYYQGTSGYSSEDSAYSYVKSILKSIGTEWSAAPDTDYGRRNSNIRFYCDEDAHFDKPSVSVPGAWIDSANNIKQFGKAPPETYALTAIFRTGIKDGAPKQAMKRCTITIYDYAWTKASQQNTFAYLGALYKSNPDADWSASLTDGVKDLHYLVSHTLLHEITHAYPYNLMDEPRDSTAYGWDNVVAKSPADSVWNADNYAYLGVLALLGDYSPNANTGGYTLARPWTGPQTTPQEKQVAADAEDTAKKGMLRHYALITKRSIKEFWA